MDTIEKIWKSLYTRLKSFILSKIPDSDMADDILQEVFIRAHTHIDRLKDQQKIVPWLYQITRNCISDTYRANKRYPPPEQYIIESEDDFTGLSDTMNTAIKDMIDMMENLRPEYCEAICAVELNGFSQIEYAKMAGIPYSTVKSRVQRARLQIKDMMMKCCHYQFDKYGTVLEIKPVTCCCCLGK